MVAAWCLGGDYALMGRSRELSQQLFNEPFDEVKAQMVRFHMLDVHLFVPLPRRRAH